MGLSDLPLASGRKHQKVFESLGWVLRRDGNHLVMTHTAKSGVTISIPNHAEVKKETLKAIVRAAGYTDKNYRLFFDAV